MECAQSRREYGAGAHPISIIALSESLHELKSGAASRIPSPARGSASGEASFCPSKQKSNDSGLLTLLFTVRAGSTCDEGAPRKLRATDR